MKAQLVILHETGPKVFYIVSFTMVEPSTNTIRFETTEHVGLESRGNPFMITAGDVDKLPPFENKAPSGSECGHNHITWNIAGYWQCATCGHVYGSLSPQTSNPQLN